jgi:hypothetical protein
VANYDELIARLNADYPDAQPRGKAFEQVCQWFLTEDPYYSQEFKNVWLWDDWPGRWGADIGIDLVAERINGDLVAVQAKCYASTVPSQEIARLLSGHKVQVKRHQSLSHHPDVDTEGTLFCEKDWGGRNHPIFYRSIASEGGGLAERFRQRPWRQPRNLHSPKY